MGFLQLARVIGALLASFGMLASGAVLMFGGDWRLVGAGVVGMVVAPMVVPIALCWIPARAEPRLRFMAFAWSSAVTLAWALGVLATVHHRGEIGALCFWSYGPTAGWTQGRPVQRVFLAKVGSIVLPIAVAHLAWFLVLVDLLFY